MSEILFHYHKIDPATWVYLSSFLMIGLFFQFNRFWSVRNLDLILLILLAPGLLMVNEGLQMGDAPAGAEATAEIAAAEGEASPTTATFGLSPDRLKYIGYLW